jgi:AcrR family transcriptional regulator
MRGVCARAALTDRYFYESFADRDALLVAVAESVRDKTIALILAAVEGHQNDPPAKQLRAALEAIVDLIANDPGSSQIFFGDHGGSDVLEALRREMIGAVVGLFMEVARPHLLPNVDEYELRLALFVGIGGFVEAVTAWRSGILDTTSDRLVEMLMGVARRMVRDFVDLD